MTVVLAWPSDRRPTDLVFCNRHRPGLDYLHVGVVFRTTINHAGITAVGRLSLHSPRRAYTSPPHRAQGLNVLFVSRQARGEPALAEQLAIAGASATSRLQVGDRLHGIGN